MLSTEAVPHYLRQLHRGSLWTHSLEPFQSPVGEPVRAKSTLELRFQLKELPEQSTADKLAR
jgi:hypothetical protein